jgi:aspartate/methionine/tyrosine aminotransferase
MSPNPVVPAPRANAAVADSLLRVPNSRVRELAKLAAGYEDVRKLYFGESNLPTPRFIQDAAADAIRAGYTFYTENAGIPSLRQVIADQYQRLHGVTVDPSTELVVTASGVQALFMALRGVLDPGDQAIVLSPAWPNGCSIIRMCNALPVEFPLTVADGRYTIDFDALEASVTPRTRLLLLTTPSNPLGWAATWHELRQLLDFTRRHNLWLLSDEVYDRIYYRDNDAVVAPSILNHCTRQDAVIVVQSFSKSYRMTGWRLGWIAARADLATRLGDLNEFVISHAASFIQRAGETAIRDGEPEIATQLAMLRTNRALCLEAFRAMPGVSLPDPEGAFYVFPRFEGLQDSFGFCARLLQEQQVGLAPGVAFGLGGEGCIRLCYAVETPLLQDALQRLSHFWQRYRANRI